MKRSDWYWIGACVVGGLATVVFTTRMIQDRNASAPSDECSAKMRLPGEDADAFELVQELKRNPIAFNTKYECRTLAVVVTVGGITPLSDDAIVTISQILSPTIVARMSKANAAKLTVGGKARMTCTIGGSSSASLVMNHCAASPVGL